MDIKVKTLKHDARYWLMMQSFGRHHCLHTNIREARAFWQHCRFYTNFTNVVDNGQHQVIQEVNAKGSYLLL